MLLAAGSILSVVEVFCVGRAVQVMRLLSVECWLTPRRENAWWLAERRARDDRLLVDVQQAQEVHEARDAEIEQLMLDAGLSDAL